MAFDIRAVREQNAINIFSLSNRKISLCVFSLCAKLVNSCLNPVNISTAWKKFKTFSFLSYIRKWEKKPSHATVPLIRKLHILLLCRRWACRGVWVTTGRPPWRPSPCGWAASSIPRLSSPPPGSASLRSAMPPPVYNGWSSDNAVR